MLAFNYQEETRDKREAKKLLRIFFREVRFNAISCGSMIKTEKFRLLDTDTLLKIKFNSSIDVNENLATYMLLVSDANSDIADYLSFLKFYTSDTKNRSNENERGLHAKRSRVIDSLRNVQENIILVRDELATRLNKLGILKKSKSIFNRSL